MKKQLNNSKKEAPEAMNDSRRAFFKTAGLGAIGAAVAPGSVAQICRSESTGVQPLGPFFPNAGTPTIPVKEDKNPNTPIYLANDNDLTYVNGRPGRAQGQVVYVSGVVTDDQCRPVPNVSIIIWQASATGRYNHNGDAGNHDFVHPITGQTVNRNLDPNFQYWGRTVSNARGEYIFKTIVPGFYPADLQNGWYRPPHIHFMASATGYSQLVTQLYFAGAQVRDNAFIQGLNQADYLLQSSSLSQKQRAALVVNFGTDATGQIKDGLVGRFDLSLSK